MPGLRDLPPVSPLCLPFPPYLRLAWAFRPHRLRCAAVHQESHEDVPALSPPLPL
jgi:hypothetical protein